MKYDFENGCYAQIIFQSGPASDWRKVSGEVQDWLNTQCKSAWGFSEGEAYRRYQPAFLEGDDEEEAEAWQHQWTTDVWALQIWIQSSQEMMLFKLAFGGAQ